MNKKKMKKLLQHLLAKGVNSRQEITESPKPLEKEYGTNN